MRNIWMGTQAYRQMERRTDGCLSRIDIHTNEYAYWLIDRQIDWKTVGCVEWWTHKQGDKSTDRRTDKCIKKQIDKPTDGQTDR